MPDLNDSFAGFLIGRAHSLGVIDRERHRLFLVDVLAGVERRDKMLAVQMLGRRDQDGVDRFVVEQAAVIVVRRRGGNKLFGVVETAGVDVGKRCEVHSRGRNGFANQLHAAIARADNTETNAVVSAQNLRMRQSSRCRMQLCQ